MARTAKTRAVSEARHPAGHCSLPEPPRRPLPDGLAPGRMELIVRSHRKWVNGTRLRYCFLDEPARWRGSQADKDAVRNAFDIWKGLPIGLEFEEVRDPRRAELRIGFEQGGGSWSYIGRDAIDFITDPAERTMNFGWDLTTPYGADTALHEIGHALGFPHEHQNPLAGIEWDEQAVYDYFRGPPNNWDDDKIYSNILRKLSRAEVAGSGWDPDSIMHYEFGAGLIRMPEKYRTEPLIPAAGLSQSDIETAKSVYPAPERPDLPLLRPYESHRIRIGAGEQVDFAVEPEMSRDYVIQTFGAMDTVMVLFEEIDGAPVYYDGDDDGGFARNARIRQRLMQGRRYLVRLRLYYAEAAGEGALMMY